MHLISLPTLPHVTLMFSHPTIATGLVKEGCESNVAGPQRTPTEESRSGREREESPLIGGAMCVSDGEKKANERWRCEHKKKANNRWLCERDVAQCNGVYKPERKRNKISINLSGVSRTSLQHWWTTEDQDDQSRYRVSQVKAFRTRNF